MDGRVELASNSHYIGFCDLSPSLVDPLGTGIVLILESSSGLAAESPLRRF
jgi:hypothetical protein